MKNLISELLFFKEKLYNGIFRNRVGCFDEAIKCIEKLEKLDKIIATLEDEQEKYANTKSDYDLDLGYYNAYEKALEMLKDLVS